MEKLGERGNVDDLQIWIISLDADDTRIGGDAVHNLIAQINRAIGASLIGHLTHADWCDVRLSGLNCRQERCQVVERRHLVEVEPIFLRQVLTNTRPDWACPGLLV